VTTDRSRGYDQLAGEFSARRSSTIGVSEVRAWAQTLKTPAVVLDLGCGIGEPITAAIAALGHEIYAIDASPNMLAKFKQRFPAATTACEAAEDSAFFHRSFDGIVAWGLMFLLPLEAQRTVIARAGAALKDNGSFLFTSPSQVCTWNDNLTGRTSISPGAEAYRQMLEEAGLTLDRELDDEGDNHYYIAVKRPS
jgi:cyclopropane fatty-acyl-phospholipid synthase-like methyltransferase